VGTTVSEGTARRSLQHGWVWSRPALLDEMGAGDRGAAEGIDVPPRPWRVRSCILCRAFH